MKRKRKEGAEILERTGCPGSIAKNRSARKLKRREGLDFRWLMQAGADEWMGG